MVAPSPLELRRRSAAERRAIELLRGGIAAAGTLSGGPGRSFRSPGEEQRKRLRELAHIAKHHGIAIQPPKVAYIHLDELRLLHLIAAAQAGKIGDGMAESLKDIIMEAGAMLASFGVDLRDAPE